VATIALIVVALDIAGFLGLGLGALVTQQVPKITINHGAAATGIQEQVRRCGIVVEGIANFRAAKHVNDMVHPVEHPV
jgi:hypothetical protein